MRPASISTCCSSIEQDKSALIRIDWSTGDESVLFGSDRGDVTGAMFDARTFEPEAACINPGTAGMDGVNAIRRR